MLNRWNWTPVTTAANAENDAALELFCIAAPKIVEVNFEPIKERIKIHGYTNCEAVLRRHFPDRF